MRVPEAGRKEPPTQTSAIIFEQLTSRMRRWPGVTVRESEERGLRFCVASGEFLHFHGMRQMDVRLPLEERDRALESGAARFHPRTHEGGWVIVRLDGPEAGQAIRLAAAAYRFRIRRCGRADRETRRGGVDEWTSRRVDK